MPGLLALSSSRISGLFEIVVNETIEGMLTLSDDVNVPMHNMLWNVVGSDAFVCIIKPSSGLEVMFGDTLSSLPF
jgi:hypothetical protein